MTSPSSPPLSVSLITGFLGSGKTTLLQRIVGSPSFKSGHSALLINDAGPVNIDAKIFRGKAREIKAVTGGCVCCVNPEEMRSALLEFAAHPEIDQVWIEASGIAETDDILDQLMNQPLPQKINLKEVIHLIDAKSFKGGFIEGFAQKNQVTLANRVIVNKVDLINPQALEKILLDIRKWNPFALIQPAVRCEVDLPPLPQTLPSEIDSPGKRKLRAHSVWKTMWIPVPEPQSLAVVQKFLDQLPEEVYRAKGFLQITEKKNKTHFIQKVGPLAETITWEYDGAVSEHGLVLLGRGEKVEKIEWKK